MCTTRRRDGVCLFLLLATMLAAPTQTSAQCTCTGITCPLVTAPIAPGSSFLVTQPTPCTGESHMVFTSLRVHTQFSLPFRVESRTLPSNTQMSGGSSPPRTACFEKSSGDLGDGVSQSLVVELTCDAANTNPCTFTYGIATACRADPCRDANDPDICVSCTLDSNCGWCDRGGRSGGECIALNGAIPAYGTCTPGVDAILWSTDDIFDCSPTQEISFAIPNAMTLWRRGDTVQIQYDNVYHVAEMDLELYPSGSSTRLLYLCDSSTAQDCTNTGTFSWTIPLSVPVGAYQIRAQDHAVAGNGGQTYFGDSVGFQILPQLTSSSTGLPMNAASTLHPSHAWLAFLLLSVYLF